MRQKQRFSFLKNKQMSGAAMLLSNQLIIAFVEKNGYINCSLLLTLKIQFRSIDCLQTQAVFCPGGVLAYLKPPKIFIS